ncbi:MAG: hypothetical protein JWO20_2588 [Candidatus Angelobacter sp.]|jgi:hypothetical protein|nr:hypothetical protein [Candidatus Angelobacter sp.]
MKMNRRNEVAEISRICDSKSVVAVQYTDQIRIREFNTSLYRLCHWPIWITVFYLLPGPLTCRLFEKGFDWQMAKWLAMVCFGTGVAGLRSRLPGVEPKPYIITFTEDLPNPLYRRLSYTAAWSDLVTFAVLNLIGTIDAIVRGKWRMRQIYYYGWIPVASVSWALGFNGVLPRTGRSTIGEWAERRVFYGAIWTVTCSQILLGTLWRGLPSTRFRSRKASVLMLVAFAASLGGLAFIAFRGRLPRTRRIVSREKENPHVSFAHSTSLRAGYRGAPR